MNASKKRGRSQNVALSGITNVAKTSEVQGRLEGELQRLSAKLGLNLDLRVVWMPDETASLSGEVKNGSIYIYEAEEEKAVQTLKHEVVDHIITSRIVKPLVDLINLLIKAREAEIYREKRSLLKCF